MRLITKEIEKRLANYPLYSQDGKGGEAIINCKFFLANLTWYVIEARKEENDYLFFGIVKNDSYGEAECGYFSLSQLTELRAMGCLGVERDMYFSPVKVQDCDELKSVMSF